MSSLIEQAAKRLQQLRQAGAEIPDQTQGKSNEELGTDGESSVSAATELPDRRPAAPAEAKPAKRVELDLDAIAASGMVSPHAPRSLIADQYRVIKRPLLAQATSKGKAQIANGNLIMVTSALPGEGKTFSAINLAMSIAMELNHTVMLVDADVAHPSLLELLGLPPQPGLLDILQGKTVSLSDTILRTNVEKLSILPGGTPHSRATELLASDAMAKLLHEMAGRYKDRIIIFDSPPLLVTTESRVLASHMGQIVVVVEAEHTSRSEVMQALETIEACPVKLAMLNKAKADFRNGYGYSYANYCA